MAALIDFLARLVEHITEHPDRVSVIMPRTNQFDGSVSLPSYEGLEAHHWPADNFVTHDRQAISTGLATFVVDIKGGA